MPGPSEKYQQPSATEEPAGPWQKYKFPGEPWQKYKFFGLGGIEAHEKNPEIPEEAVTGVARFALESLPAIGATAAAAVVGGPSMPLWAPVLYSALGGAGGSMLKSGIKHGLKLPDAPQTPGELFGEAGKDALIQSGAEVGGRLVSGVLSKMIPTPERLYQSALKPVFNKRQGGAEKTAELVKTGLEYGITPSAVGLGQAGKAIEDINKKIMQGIQARADVGAEVDLKSVVQRLNDLREYYRNTVRAPEYLAAIDKVERQFLGAHTTKAPYTEIARSEFDETGQLLPPELQRFHPVAEREAVVSTKIPLQKAQQIKQHQGTLLRKKYGELSSVEEDEATKQIVRGLKEEIESIFPEVKKLNAIEGRLIDLEAALNRFVHREGNLELMGIGVPIVGTVGGVVGGTGGAMAAMTAQAALKDPGIKTQIAFALDRWRKLPGVKAAKAVGRHIPRLSIRLGEAGVRSLPTPPPLSEQQ